MFLGLLNPDLDPLVKGMDPDPSIIKQKIVRKTYLDYYCFVTSFFYFLFLKNDLNVPSKSTKQIFFKLVISWPPEGQ
jgi:hypothetical protein